MKNPFQVELSTVRRWVKDAEYVPLLALARHKKRTLSMLTALTYDEDASVSEAAIIASGMAAKIIAERDPEYIRNYLLRLFWLVNDESGGIGWKAPELIGEILFNCPGFEQFFPLLISLLEIENEDAPRFRAGTIWAIGRVAQSAKEAMAPALPLLQSVILDGNILDPTIKEKARWCIAQITETNAITICHKPD